MIGYQEQRSAVFHPILQQADFFIGKSRIDRFYPPGQVVFVKRIGNDQHIGIADAFGRKAAFVRIDHITVEPENFRECTVSSFDRMEVVMSFIY